MARKKKVKRKSRRRIGLAVLGGIFGSIANVIPHLLNRDWIRAISRLSMNFSGVDPRDGTWKPERMVAGYGPLALGAVISVGAGKVGLKRAVSNSNPLVTF